MPERTLLLIVLQAVGVHSSGLPGKDWSVLITGILAFMYVLEIKKC